ncbi:hypothetical protein MTO96_017993 [Rhipicephalus appendiculatus]
MSPGLALVNRKQQSHATIAGFLSLIPPVVPSAHSTFVALITPQRHNSLKTFNLTQSDIVCRVATDRSVRCTKPTRSSATEPPNQTHQVPAQTAVHSNDNLLLEPG